MTMSNSDQDVQQWVLAARMLISAAYALAESFDQGENIMFSLVIMTAADELAKAADNI